jgi:prepilin-type N-terminal cleavage/methylation domain-containing protein
MTGKIEKHAGRQNEAGFSLIEVMVAMVILTVGILGIMVLQVKSARYTALSTSATRATALARMHMETIIQADYDAPGMADINTSNNSMLGSRKNVDYRNVDVKGKGVRLGRYTLCWNTADNMPVKNTRTIVVIVSWNHGRRARQFTFIKPLVS